MDEQCRGPGWYIKRIDNALAREAARNLSAHQLTLQQGHALLLLSQAPERRMSMKELEARFGAAQSTVAGLVMRLEKKGLVKGTTDPRDRRVKLVELTEEGVQLQQACHQDMLAGEERLKSLLTAEELTVFMTCLQKLHQAVR